MKVIRTTLGWELQPENESDEARIRGVLQQLLRNAELAYDSALRCPHCLSQGGYGGFVCYHCDYRMTSAKLNVNKPLSVMIGTS